MGYNITFNLSPNIQINHLISSLYYRINTIKSVARYTTMETRLNLANAFVMGKLNYLLPLINPATKYDIDRLQKAIMTTARMVIGHYCYKWSTVKILEKCYWPNLYDMIKINSLKTIHSIVIHKSPINIYENIKFPRRSCAEITLRDIPSYNITRQFYFYTFIKHYSNLPKQIKMLENRKYKFHVKYFIMNNRVHSRLK